ncbi:hypothetical protein GDO86_013724 [Hymenochirus boettgeri]|uniref:Uncharacterized protein n=1 Tax=Hymenochirus boettgeri TaxID=247094 RepID=A0A8T2JRE2_9PIPI|nr:hypothetical protein GDO86_013724 [Hymenochirus boettgeri]
MSIRSPMLPLHASISVINSNTLTKFSVIPTSSRFPAHVCSSVGRDAASIAKSLLDFNQEVSTNMVLPIGQCMASLALPFSYYRSINVGK